MMSHSHTPDNYAAARADLHECWDACTGAVPTAAGGPDEDDVPRRVRELRAAHDRYKATAEATWRPVAPHPIGQTSAQHKLDEIAPVADLLTLLGSELTEGLDMDSESIGSLLHVIGQRLSEVARG